ncbi:MAG: CoA-binding protein [Acidobacteriota bacterium]
MVINEGIKIKEILQKSKTIAIVGCSRDPEKDAHKVPKYLKEHGYKIIPINPSADEILGERVYKTLSEIKEPIDIVDIFRPSEECLGVVKEAIKIKPKVIWMQLGIKNEEAAKLAEKKGIEIVMDKCIMIEHKHLIK